MAEPRTFVLDSSVLILYIAGDNRVETLVNKISDGMVEGYMIEPSISEIYSKLNEKFGIGEANKVLDAIRNSRIKVIDVDYELMKKAGELKSTYKGKLSMIAAYMAALAKNLNAVLVTSDESITKIDGVKVEFVKVKG